MNAPEIVAYIYKADIYSPSDILDALGVTESEWDVETTLDVLADQRGIVRYDEWTFDSDDFPKVVFQEQL